MNEILFLIEIVLAFGSVVLISRYIGKAGLFAWMAGAVIIANLVVAKQITVFGIGATLGNVAFASTYLVTDIFNELYGFKESRKAVYCTLIGAGLFVGTAFLSVRFIPNELDFIQNSLSDVLAISTRVTIASVVALYCSNLCDVYIYEKLKQKIPGKMWLRNNVSTVLCNCTENFLLTYLGFYGILSGMECFWLSVTTSIVETLIAFCDTPFLYLAKRLGRPR